MLAMGQERALNSETLPLYIVENKHTPNNVNGVQSIEHRIISLKGTLEAFESNCLFKKEIISDK